MLDLSKVATSEEEDEAGVVDLELLRAQLQDLVRLPPDPGHHRQAAGCLIPVDGKEGVQEICPRDNNKVIIYFLIS